MTEQQSIDELLVCSTPEVTEFSPDRNINPLGNVSECVVNWISDFHIAPQGKRPKVAGYAKSRIIPEPFWRRRALRNRIAFREHRTFIKKLAQGETPSLFVVGGDLPEFIEERKDVDEAKSKFELLKELILDAAATASVPAAVIYLSGNHDFNNHFLYKNPDELEYHIDLANYWHEQFGFPSFMQTVAAPRTGNRRILLGLDSELYSPDRKRWLENAQGPTAAKFRRINDQEMEYQNALVKFAASQALPITLFSHYQIPYRELPITPYIVSHIHGHVHIPYQKISSGVNTISTRSVAQFPLPHANKVLQVHIDSDGKETIKRIPVEK